MSLRDRLLNGTTMLTAPDGGGGAGGDGGNNAGGAVDPTAARAFVSDFVADPTSLTTMEDTKVLELHGRVNAALDKHRPVKDWKADIADENLKKLAEPFKSPVDALKKLAEPPPDWRTQITDTSLRKQADKFNSPTDAIKSYAELQSRLGKSIVIPGEKATAEEIAAYREKIGVPKEAAGYEIAKPAHYTDDIFKSQPVQDRLNRMRQAAFDAGVPAAAFAKQVDGYFAMEAESIQAEQEARDKADKDFAAANEAALRKDWGNDFEKNKSYAAAFLTQYGAGDAQALRDLRTSDGRYLLDHPLVLKLLSAGGRAIGEDTLGAVSTQEKTTLQERLDELTKKPDYWTNEGIQREVAEINAKLYPGTYTPGSGFLNRKSA